MNNVQFDEQSFSSTPRRRGGQPTGISKLIINMGLAKDERGANIVMIGLIAVLCIISFFSLTSLGGGGDVIEDDPTLYEEFPE